MSTEYWQMLWLVVSDFCSDEIGGCSGHIWQLIKACNSSNYLWENNIELGEFIREFCKNIIILSLEVITFSFSSSSAGKKNTVTGVWHSCAGCSFSENINVRCYCTNCRRLCTMGLLPGVVKSVSIRSNHSEFWVRPWKNICRIQM